MKIQMMFVAMTACLLVAACGSQPKETTSSESLPSPVEATVPPPAPAAAAPATDVQACDGKAARDACSYTSEKGEIKGTCVRSETYTLQCLPKKSRKK
jgi:hypothetical protein